MEITGQRVTVFFRLFSNIYVGNVWYFDKLYLKNICQEMQNDPIKNFKSKIQFSQDSKKLLCIKFVPA